MIVMRIINFETINLFNYLAIINLKIVIRFIYLLIIPIIIITPPMSLKFSHFKLSPSMLLKFSHFKLKISQFILQIINLAKVNRF